MHDTRVRVSALQRSVSAALAAIRFGFEEEYVKPRTGHSLDLALPSSRIAIEVDGPFHFTCCPTADGRGVRKTQRANRLLKRRLLAAAGWRVISVPRSSSGTRLHSASERQAYLERIRMHLSLY